MIHKVIGIGFEPPQDTILDLTAEVTKQVMEELYERGLNPYVHTIDIRLVVSNIGYSAIQVRTFPRQTAVH
jgi:hypothetical protein